MKPQTNDPTSPTIGIEEAAEILRCSLPTVQKLIAIGDLPVLHLNQRHWVMLREDVVEYIRAQARVQAQARKAEHDRRNAPRPPAPATSVKSGGVRRRRPLPDLDKLEALFGKSDQKT